MGFVSVSDAAQKWSISTQKLVALCSEGHVPRAKRINDMWIIPDDIDIPIDRHISCVTSCSSVKSRPFVKWAGGKGQLLDNIRSIYPDELGRKINKYAEPFVGGGAVLFDILSQYHLDAVYISDINAELINAYIVIRDNVSSLIDMLTDLQRIHLSMDDRGRNALYYEKRDRYNSIKCSNGVRNDVESAALFIYLNKTCFNGLYRVNKKNLFNVPIGAYKNPRICDPDNLMAISLLLRNVTIVCADYRQSRKYIDDRTFVYCDPPYRPISATADFTSYTENPFDDKAQAELAEYVQELDKKGAHVIVSNSDPKNTDPNDDFFDKLYSNQIIMRVPATRMINRNADSRGKINELLIRNYNQHNNQTEVIPMERNFAEWLSKFRSSISDYGYYVDFNKVYQNVDGIRIELNILNSLIGSKHIEDDFVALVKKYPDTLKAIPILLAKRESEIFCQDENGGCLYQFDYGKYIPNSHKFFNQYTYFMRETGLFGLLENHIINNLVDYVTGVETGLDSNGRKNRGGHLMENLVESFIKKAGFLLNRTYYKEMYLSDIERKWGISLSAISNRGKAEKRFDFVVKTENMIYAIETNFYSGGGSKLNETARSYKTLASEAATIDGFTFVWFTDGKGWVSARNNLEETFDITEYIYSIDDMENGIMSKLFV